jgi:hypothetical protein
MWQKLTKIVKMNEKQASKIGTLLAIS